MTVRYRWRADAQGFHMPIKITGDRGKWITVEPDENWKTLKLVGLMPEQFRVAEDQFYVETRITRTYVDPQRPN